MSQAEIILFSDEKNAHNNLKCCMLHCDRDYPMKNNYITNKKSLELSTF